MLPDHLHAIIGAPSRRVAKDLAIELAERGIFRLNPAGATSHFADDPHLVSFPTDINLTLDGWQKYEDEQRGQFAGNYGFIASRSVKMGVNS